MVLKVAFHIVFWSAFVILGRPDPAKDAAATASDSPFDVRFQDLDGPDQRIFRLIQEGVVEAEAQRSRSKRWPTVEDLARDLIPPFAPDPIDKAGYAWSVRSADGVVNYVGAPSQQGRHTFVVLITEPPPGTPNDPNATVDEVHHRLSDGTMIHVNIFVGPGLDESVTPVAFLPAEAGWRRVTTVVPAR